MKTMGIDLSINSTGICVGNHYYIITSKMTKKQKSFSHPNITILDYPKGDSDSNNIREIGQIIEQIITKHKPDFIIMEDIAMGAKSRSIITLSLLNGYIRAIIDKQQIPFQTVPPCQWKKQMLGNGQADKDLTIYHWKRLQPQFNNLEIKVDDIADSYFLSNYEINI